ncbi:MAG: T9SS type A sorting domain-containing protein [Bacteroidia bacterium]
MRHWILLLIGIIYSALMPGKLVADNSGIFPSDTLYLCQGEPFTLSGTFPGGVGPYTFLWNTGDTTASILIIPIQGVTNYFLSISDATGSVISDTVEVMAMPECVWPGDTDGDGIVNNRDVLSLGLAFDTQGMIRPDAHTNFIGQGAPAWQQVFSSGINFVHADTDGNGLVDEDDFYAVGANYTGPVNTPGGSVIAFDGIPVYIDWPAGNYQPGDTIRGAIMVGTEESPADSVYGISFSIMYDPAFVDSAFVSYDSSWLGTLNTDMRALDKNFPLSGQIDVGMTRTNHISIAGAGKVADITVMIDDITGKKDSQEILQIRAEKITLVNAAGTTVPISETTGSSIISLSNESLIDRPFFQVYPNPADAEIWIESDLPQGVERVISVWDLQGKEWIGQNRTLETKFKLSIEALPAGMYLVSLEHAAGREWQKLVLR